MPRLEEIRRGGVTRYRTIRRGGRVMRISVVRKAGPRGGHTVGTVVRKKG